MTNRMGKVDLSMLMGMYMTVNGLMEKLMVMVNTSILTELHMKALGSRTSRTAKVKRLGKTAQATKAPMSRA